MILNDSGTDAPSAPEAAQPELQTPAQTGQTPTDSGANLSGEQTEQQASKAAEKSPEQLELERLRRQLTKRDRTQGKLYADLQRAQAELQRLQKSPDYSGSDSDANDDPPQRQAIDQAEIDRRAEERAREIARTESINQRCNDIAEKATKQWPDFGDAVKVVHEEAGALFTPKGPTPLMEAILDCDDPAAVLYALGKAPDVAASLDGLTERQIARKLTKFELDLASKPQPKSSAAPKPLDPVRPSSAGVRKSEAEMSDDEWYRARRKR